MNKTYKCAHCGVELSKPVLASFNTYFDHVKPSDLTPKYYVCPHCGYSGTDLSAQPTDEQKEILDSDEFLFFLRNGFVHQQSFKVFVLGYTFYKEGKYSQAIKFLSQAYNTSHHLAPFKEGNDSKHFEDHLNNKGVSFEIIADNSPGLFDLYIDQLIVEIASNMDYKCLDTNIMCWIIDALRRVGQFEKALSIIKDVLTTNPEKIYFDTINREQELCLKKDYITKLVLLPNPIPYVY